MSYIHADQPWCTVHYHGEEYGLLGGFHFGEAIEREITEIKRQDPSKYAYASRATKITRPAWRVDKNGRLWLEEIRVLTYTPPSKVNERSYRFSSVPDVELRVANGELLMKVITLPNHPYPIPGTWVESMRLLASEEIISPNKTGKVTVRQEILTLWFEEGRVVETKRTREEVRVIRLGNYIEK